MLRALTVTLLMLALSACGTAVTTQSSAPSQGASVPTAPVPPPPPIPEEDAIVCPADVQLCPDGRYVSRDPARRCAFDPCSGAR